MSVEPHQPRPASLEESDRVAALFRSIWTRSLPFLPVLHTAEEDRAFFKDQVFHRCTVAVVEAEGALRGFIAHRPGWVDHLYVAPDWQRRGIGRALLDEAKKAHPILQLWAFQQNRSAIAFYLSQGLRQVRTTDGSGNEEREPDVLLEWRRGG